MALKYHPDKNPKTTALFQAIQTASDRLSDPDKRKEAEKNAPNNTNTTSSSAPKNTQKPTNKPYDYYSNGKSSAHDAKASGPSQKPKKEDNYFSQQQQARDEANAKFNEYAKAHFKKASDAKYAEFDAKFRQWKEGEDQARKHKDDILRQGQRAYFEEQQKARDREREREKEKDDHEKRRQQYDADAARKAAASNKPSMTPDEINYQKNKNNLNSFNNNKASDSSNNGNKASNSSNSNSSSNDGNYKKGPYAHYYGTQSEMPGNIGKTFTANSNGDVRMNDSNKSKPKSGIGMKEVNESIKYFCRPYGLKCTSLGSTSVDIEWSIPIQAPSEKMSFEVSWRNLAHGTHSWNSASKLIKTKQVRKKNLDVGASYEFRVRSVLELSGGMLGDRSEWSGSINIKLLNDSTSASSPSKQKDNKTKQDSNKNNNNNNNNKHKPNPFHEDEGIISSDDDALENTSRQAWGRTFHQEVEEDDELKKFEQKFKDHADNAKENEKQNNNPEDEDWYDLKAPPGQYNYEHKVYTEPKLGSSVIGYLMPGMCVISKHKANSGSSSNKNWLYVHTHKKHTPANYDKSKNSKNSEWGWSMISDALHQFLVRVEDPLVDEELDDEAVDIEEENFDYKYRYEPNVDEWAEEVDPKSGTTYYYNLTTGESQWEPPEWVEHVDPQSGAAYYLKMDKSGHELHSTWSRPIKFARIIRNSSSNEKGGSNEKLDYTQDFEDFDDD